ncbi:MAG: cation:proton antiporter, partial [bacterium]
MIEVAVLLAVAAIAHGIARWSGVPAVPLMVVAGALASVTGLVSAPTVEDVLVLSLSVLLFTAGTALEVPASGRLRSITFRIATLQFLALGGLGLGAALLFGYGWEASLYMAAALAASSTLLGVRLLQRRKQMFEPHGRLVMGVLLLQDLAIIALIPVLTWVGAGVASIAAALGAALVLVLLSLATRRWVVPAIFRRISSDGETWLLVSLGVLFGFLGVGTVLDVPAVTSSFLAGFSLSRFPAGTAVRGQLTSLTDFFSALFFTALGTWIVVPGGRELVESVVLAGIVILATPPIVAVAAERWGFTARNGILSGFILAQTSEFSLVVALQGVTLGLVEPVVFTVIALTTVLTMSATPLLATDRVTWSVMRWHPHRRPKRFSGDGAPPAEGHVVLLGCGSNGMQVLDLLFLEGVPVTVVEGDPAVVAALENAKIPVVRGDAADRDALVAADVTSARVVVSTLRRARDNGPVLEMARRNRVPVLVRVFEKEEERWIQRRGGIPVSFA